VSTRGDKVAERTGNRDLQRRGCVVIASKFAREHVRMNVCELKVEPTLAHSGGKNFPGGGQSAGEAAE
jgi:hypothetical protein